LKYLKEKNVIPSPEAKRKAAANSSSIKAGGNQDLIV